MKQYSVLNLLDTHDNGKHNKPFEKTIGFILLSVFHPDTLN